MTLTIDPQQREVRALARVGDWRSLRVLEVGCGTGRLSLRLAGLGARVHAIDPNADLIEEARRQLPRPLAPRVHYEVGTAEQLAAPNSAYDRVVFSWVL